MNNIYRGNDGKEQEKSIITIWATERGKLHQDVHDFTFGTGTSEFTGYHGRQLRIGLCVDTVHSYDIAVTVNGEEKGNITKSAITLDDVEKDKYQSVYNIFSIPTEVKAGDIINFKVKQEVRQSKSTIVSLLIELDIP